MTHAFLFIPVCRFGLCVRLLLAKFCLGIELQTLTYFNISIAPQRGVIVRSMNIRDDLIGKPK